MIQVTTTERKGRKKTFKVIFAVKNVEISNNLRNASQLTVSVKIVFTQLTGVLTKFYRETSARGKVILKAITSLIRQPPDFSWVSSLYSMKLFTGAHSVI